MLCGPDAPHLAHLHDQLIDVKTNGQSRVIDTIDGECFLHLSKPSPRIILIGVVHISQVIIEMARLCCFEVLVVDPRAAFATDFRFPDMEISSDWPDTAVANIGVDSHTAIVTLTHDPKLDDPALQAAVDTDAFFIGALGSRKTHAQRLERLRSSGVSEKKLARIDAPVGLGIGAKGPAEIVMSVMSQIIEQYRCRLKKEIQ